MCHIGAIIFANFTVEAHSNLIRICSVLSNIKNYGEEYLTIMSSFYEIYTNYA